MPPNVGNTPYGSGDFGSGDFAESTGASSYLGEDSVPTLTPYIYCEGAYYRNSVFYFCSAPVGRF